jgi:hypothetical protein
MSSDRRQEWQQAYQAALLEVDPAKLGDRISHAYAVIQAYRDEAAKNDAEVDHEGLSDALSNLRVLRREAGLPANHTDQKDPDNPATDR